MSQTFAKLLLRIIQISENIHFIFSDNVFDNHCTVCFSINFLFFVLQHLLQLNKLNMLHVEKYVVMENVHCLFAIKRIEMNRFEAAVRTRNLISISISRTLKLLSRFHCKSHGAAYHQRF